LFVGRAVVEAAAGHEVTLFNRGETNAELFPDVEKLRGDRTGDLEALRGRSFDACIDANARESDWVRRSLDAVDAPYYLFVSSVSAYADLSGPVDENTPTHPAGEEYGQQKAEADRLVLARGGGAVVRPGLIVGPHDPTGRFTYWPHRIARGGDVLAPGSPDDPVQLIDVRDLAEWLVRLAEQRTEGVFNAVRSLTRGELVDVCVQATGSNARLHWVPSDRLVAAGVEEWMEVPLWIADPDFAGMLQADNRRAVAAGLTFRPLEDTVRATLAHAETVEGVGLAPEREAELLR
jgi:2'-hydroxyisoflavone reductase